MKKPVYLVVVLSILAAFLQYEVLVYRALIPALLWSNETLYLNVAANRMGWRNCKRFGLCEVRSIHSPRWRIIQHDMLAFQG